MYSGGVLKLLHALQHRRVAEPSVHAMTTFEAARTLTGWQRPGRDHGCKPCEIVPGVWTAHYHDIDSKEKLRAATRSSPITLVVNTAPCQCESRDGFYGPRVSVMAVDLEDDPDERKY